MIKFVLPILIELITEQGLYTKLQDAGFPTESLHTMVCIARKESSLNPIAININKNGSVDYGLFQINDKWWGNVCPIETILIPENNIACAYKVYKEMGYNGWVAYKKNREYCNNYKVTLNDK